MSISKRVTEAICYAENGDFEAALIPSCIAVDATAQLEYGARGSNRELYKRFLRENADIIGYAGLRIVARNIRLRNPDPTLKLRGDGTCTFDELLYHVVRCGLLHSGSIDQFVVLSDSVLLGYDEHRVVVYRSIVWGLLFSVVLAPCNSQQKLPNEYWLGVDGNRWTVMDLWGRREFFRGYMVGRMLEMRHAQSRAT